MGHPVDSYPVFTWQRITLQERTHMRRCPGQCWGRRRRAAKVLREPRMAAGPVTEGARGGINSRNRVEGGSQHARLRDESASEQADGQA
jgi:hypothetical protein